jgi:ferredoxin
MTFLRVENAAKAELWQWNIDSSKPLLPQLEAQWVEIPNACRTGMCSACMCTVVKWQEHIVNNLRGEPAFPLWEDEIMTCIGWIAETDDEIILRTMT